MRRLAKPAGHRQAFAQCCGHRAAGAGGGVGGCGRHFAGQHLHLAGDRCTNPAGRGSEAGFGGLSGPAIKPLALRFVYQAAKSVKIPVIGLGGIASGEDAAEFLIAGAQAVEVGTATFWDPAAPLKIAEELARFLHRPVWRTFVNSSGRYSSRICTTVVAVLSGSLQAAPPGSGRVVHLRGLLQLSSGGCIAAAPGARPIRS